MYLLREDNHGELAVVENPYRAVEWLWKEHWLDAQTDYYIPEKEDFAPLYKKLGYKSAKEITHFSLVENHFLNLELQQFFEEMESFGFYFSTIEVIE